LLNRSFALATQRTIEVDKRSRTYLSVPPSTPQEADPVSSLHGGSNAEQMSSSAGSTRPPTTRFHRVYPRTAARKAPDFNGGNAAATHDHKVDDVASQAMLDELAKMSTSIRTVYATACRMAQYVLLLPRAIRPIVAIAVGGRWDRKM